ncbi:prepilin-type N-terminal cleavage/methylation domain-containing protein [Luteibacter sp. ME-Dv--P-043b]|uniref:prepilin-type N-terminal cleavage/methylation domain-containing protein n=1 Tax=unclassified Luteibacter TaxID=2620188 RepID=UPI002556309C|nr:prepilin-type N-terminal cleavage/methylation domain-containing protein [Luteibacter sp. ME-Dv--P-043b]
MSQHGSSLVELLVSLAVAGMVAAVVATGAGAAGMASRRHLDRVQREDAARMALAVLAEDLANSSRWLACTEARDCDVTVRHRPYRSYLLHTDVADWLVGDGLRRCVKQCESLLEGIVRLDVVADLPDAAGQVRRLPFQERHRDTARLLEVGVVLADGTRFSRVVAKRQ